VVARAEEARVVARVEATVVVTAEMRVVVARVAAARVVARVGMMVVATVVARVEATVVETAEMRVVVARVAAARVVARVEVMVVATVAARVEARVAVAPVPVRGERMAARIVTPLCVWSRSELQYSIQVFSSSKSYSTVSFVAVPPRSPNFSSSHSPRKQKSLRNHDKCLADALPLPGGDFDLCEALDTYM
jgi:hypothetical protein